MAFSLRQHRRVCAAVLSLTLGGCAVGSTSGPDVRDVHAADRTDEADVAVENDVADVLAIDAVDVTDAASVPDASDVSDVSDASDVSDVSDVSNTGCRSDGDCAGTVVPACQRARCETSTGQCVPTPVNDGDACDDGDGCTQGDACRAGHCVAGAPLVCAAIDACHVAGVCDPRTGACSNPAVTDGTGCNDGNACTTTDRCLAGICTGNARVCNALDACHQVGTCNPATGICDNPTRPDGDACDDGNACTMGDSCLNGLCSAGTPRTCTPSDSCHGAGTCDRNTGVCSNPALPDGSACDDGDACTRVDACVSARCVGGSPVTCPAPAQCLAAGRCDPSTGACAYLPLADGTSCDDGSACTRTDSCSGGSCVGGNRVVCVSSDQCHPPGACDPTTGACSNPSAVDGASCNDGNACTTGEACHAGACSGGTGSCTPVVISEFRLRGPAGGNDEFIEVYNNSDAPLDFSGWTLRGSNNAGTVGIRTTVPAATTIPARGHYLFAQSTAVVAVTPDRTYSSGIADDGGIAIARPDGTIVDQVGMSAGSAYAEGTPLAPLTSNADRSYERRPGGATGSEIDTGNNAADFVLTSPTDPQNLASPMTPAIAVSPTFLYWGAAIGSSASSTLTITNNAAYTVTLTPPFVISGPAAADFSVAAPGTSTLVAGGSTSVRVTFQPLASGSRTATLTVSSSNGGSPTVMLSGNGS